MNTDALNPMLRAATIKAIDGVAKKLTAAERTANSRLGKLLQQWNELEPDDKEQIAAITVATLSTAVAAAIAMRRKPVKTLVKKVAKKAVKKVARKLT